MEVMPSTGKHFRNQLSSHSAQLDHRLTSISEFILWRFYDLI